MTPRARESDRERPGGDARVAVAGPDQGGARESAAPAGSRPPVRAWRAFRAPDGVRDRSASRASRIGSRRPEQWGAKPTPVDFFDVKEDLEALFARTGAPDEFGYVADTLPACTRAAARGSRAAARPSAGSASCTPNWCRNSISHMHRSCSNSNTSPALAAKMPRFEEISRFPRVRRDLAVVVDEKVSLRQLHERVTFAASSLLRDIRVFDVYRGPGIETGRKSVALGLIFQDNSRTLTDEDADRLLAAIRADLSATLGAGFRE